MRNSRITIKFVSGEVLTAMVQCSGKLRASGHIYKTDYFRRLYERQAYMNISNEMRGLRATSQECTNLHIPINNDVDKQIDEYFATQPQKSSTKVYTNPKINKE